MPAFYGRHEGDRVVIDGGDARHLARSLRARPGESIEVVDPDGWMLTVRLESIGDTKVEGLIEARREYRPEPDRRVVIAISHLPSSSLELVLSRCTEAGAYGFHVVQAERSVARGARQERWQTIIREAAMLSGRLRVPVVAGPSRVAEVLEESPNPVMLVRSAPTRLASLSLAQDVTLLIGPEGGWTEQEVGLAPITANLGPRNMRADTAALVALAIALVNA